MAMGWFTYDVIHYYLTTLIIVIHGAWETDAHQTGAKLKHGEGRRDDSAVRIVELF